jgi:hypothetical protein
MKDLSIVTAIVVVIGSGFVHGTWTDRWKVSDEVGAAVAALGRVGRTIGDWTGQDLELAPEPLERAGVAGYLCRHYEDRRTGAAVTVLIVCGRPGPIAVHTPDVCYPGVGFDAAGPPTRHPVRIAPSAPPVEFWTLDLTRVRSAVPEHLRIFYTWRAGGAWTAATNSRLAFAHSPALYKLYLIRETRAPDESLADDPALELARRLLPELDRSLVPGP